VRLGIAIGSSNDRSQPRSAMCAPVVRHALASIEPAIFFLSPGAVIPPSLKVGFGACRKIVGPGHFECSSRSFKAVCRAILVLSRAARIRPHVPFPLLDSVRDAGAVGDHPDPDPGKANVPSLRPIVDAFAGEGGHRPIEARNRRSRKPLGIVGPSLGCTCRRFLLQVRWASGRVVTRHRPDDQAHGRAADRALA
jgi:hypothetical protein